MVNELFYNTGQAKPIYNQGAIRFCLAVEAKQQKHYVSIGQEMIAHHKENHPFPTVVENRDGDCLAVRRVKRVISNMTKFKPIHRKQITEVEEEMSGIKTM